MSNRMAKLMSLTKLIGLAAALALPAAAQVMDTRYENTDSMIGRKEQEIALRGKRQEVLRDVTPAELMQAAEVAITLSQRGVGMVLDLRDGRGAVHVERVSAEPTGDLALGPAVTSGPWQYRQAALTQPFERLLIAVSDSDAVPAEKKKKKKKAESAAEGPLEIECPLTSAQLEETPLNVVIFRRADTLYCSDPFTL